MFKSNPLKQFVFELRSIDVTQNLRLSLNRSICVLVRQSRGSASSQTTTNMYFAFPHYRGSYIRTTDRCSRRRGGGDGIVDFFLPRSSQNSAFETRSNQYTTVSILHVVVWGYKKHYIVCDKQIY